MAEFQALETLTLEAAADLSLHQYTVMRLSAANKCNVASLATDSSMMGVLINKPKSSEFATIAYFGKCKVIAGAAITAGAVLTINSSGRAITVTSGNLEMNFGSALETAAANGDVIGVLLKPPARWAGAA